LAIKKEKKMPNKMSKIKSALSTMKVGQIKNVRVGPGREGLVTVRKETKSKPTILRRATRQTRSKSITKKR